ncbi:hypothetical protein KC349_g5179 [Hortaea werneckii]|nr:hypothetical protein KC349_g5179 [Hortaea werneckii]
MDLAQNRDGAAQKLWPLDRASIWKPLSKKKREIRILLLQPSEEEDDALYADLEIASLDNPPEYKAISYVWGDASDTTAMFVNGGKVIQITKNLAAALRRFREDRVVAPLWADAVCINQADLRERADQVSMMAEIYATAIEVNAWLGEDIIDPGLRDILHLLVEKCRLPQHVKCILEHGCAIDETIEQTWSSAFEALTADPDKVSILGDYRLLGDCFFKAQLLLTVSGLAGSTSIGAQTGDFVTLIPGCRLPFLIRRQDDSKEELTFRLIGPCYIDGIMGDDAMRFMFKAYWANANTKEIKAMHDDINAALVKLREITDNGDIDSITNEPFRRLFGKLSEEIVLV